MSVGKGCVSERGIFPFNHVYLDTNFRTFLRKGCIFTFIFSFIVLIALHQEDASFTSRGCIVGQLLHFSVIFICLVILIEPLRHETIEIVLLCS